MDLKRITVDEVLEAYAALDVQRTKGCYHRWQEGDEGDALTHCGCPAFVVAVVRSGLTVDQACHGGAANFTHDQFHPAYLNGFTTAVDTGLRRESPYHEDSVWMESYGEGGEDGLAVRAALWPEPANA